MGKLEDMLERQRRADRIARETREALLEYSKDVKSGKETTGDPVKDFCISHLTFDREDAIRTTLERLQPGEPLLVHTNFKYYVKFKHNFAPEHDTEHTLMTLDLLRFCPVTDAKMTNQGIVIPTPRYAYSLTSGELWIPHWEANPGPLVIGVPELMDENIMWDVAFYEKETPFPDERSEMLRSPPVILSGTRSSMMSERKRKDLPQVFWDAYQAGPAIHNNPQLSRTRIFIGETALETFKGWDIREAHRNHGKNAPRDHYADALFCVQHGMSHEEHDEREEGSIRKTRLRIAEGLVRAVEAKDDDIKERLRLGAEAGVQELAWKRTGKGVIYQFPEFFIRLCEEFDVEYKR